ncbi:MAG: hypothetical protein WD963_02060 [Candidatus Paceibacterota bacterium]
MKKLLKHELFIPVSAILLALAVVAIAYTGIQYWNGYKMQKVEAMREEEEQQQKLELQQAEEDLEQALKEQLRDEELAELRQQLLDLQQKSSTSKTIVNTIEAKDPVANIVKEWSPRIAHIKCNWYHSNGALYGTASGSATLVNFTYLGVRAITSRHLFLSGGLSFPKDCRITLTDTSSYSVLVDSESVSVGQEEDWAYVVLPSDNTLTNITKQNIKLCSGAELGDRLLILGYPGIGSVVGLTVTEGIVSGFDENYYITSAKIDKGNSGGAAISVKDNCYLGIPTASVVGQIESLGRILKAEFFIE